MVESQPTYNHRNCKGLGGAPANRQELAQRDHATASNAKADRDVDGRLCHGPSVGEVQPMRIVIPGQPIPKGRPRVFRNGRTITPKRTAEFEARAASIIRASWDGAPIPKGQPVALFLRFYFRRPKRLQTKATPDHALPMPRRPDLDNLIKSTMDALERGAVLSDDGQVMNIHAEKWYCSTGQPVPRIVIKIEVQP